MGSSAQPVPPLSTWGLVCPHCSTVLRAGREALSCETCHRSWPVQDEIASFCDRPPCREAQEVPPLISILDQARVRSLEKALHDRFPHENPAGYWHIYDPPCADWFHLGPVAARDLAIVLGVGWGAVPMRLARLFRHVVVVDWVWERAEFARRLLAHEGLGNATVVHAGLAALPLPEEAADLVVFMGEFEWAALHAEHSSAESAQRAMLARLVRLLRPGGSLCLGVSNRFAAGRVMGRRDNGRPPWAGVLPRPLGNLYGALRGEPAQHALSHSPAGYRRLLTAAGFTDVRSYAAFPSYHHPRMLVPLADPEGLAWAVRLSLARRGRHLGMGSKLVHCLASSRPFAAAGCRLSDSLVVWARRPQPKASSTATDEAAPISLREALARRVRAEWPLLGLGARTPRSFSVAQLSGNWDRGGKVNWFLFPDRARDPAVIAKVARTPADAGRMEHEYRMLLWLRSLEPAVREHLPRPLARWEINGHLVTLQEYLAWPPLGKEVARLSPESGVLHALRVALPFFTQVAVAGRRESANLCLAKLIEGGRQAAESQADNAASQVIIQGLVGLAQEAAGLAFTVPHHGDVSAADILTTDASKLHVLDWEWSVREGVPLIDLVSLALSAASRHDAAIVRRTIRGLAQLPSGFEERQPELDELVNGYCEAVGLPVAWRKPMVAAALLNAILRMPECRISSLIISLPDETDEIIVAARALLDADQGPGGLPELQSLLLRMRQ